MEAVKIPVNPMDGARFHVELRKLRDFFRHVGRQPFCTPDFMESVDLQEPSATAVLVQLAEAHWISYEGRSDDVDTWSLDRLGIQFSLKKLLHRIPAAKARAILDRALDAVREFNRLDHSTRITRVLLFGSLLNDGDESGTVGDIDLEITIERRGDVPADELARMRISEEAQAPASMWDLHGWAMRAGLRAIRKVSNHISASTHSNIEELGCRNMEIYRFCAQQNCEMDADSKIIPEDFTKSSEFNQDRASTIELPKVPRRRPYPKMTLLLKSINIESVDAVAADWLWHQGLSIDDMSNHRLLEGSSPMMVEAALASISRSPKPQHIARPILNPYTAILPAIQKYPDAVAEVTIERFRTPRAWVRLETPSDMISVSCMDGDVVVNDARLDTQLEPLARDISIAAEQWLANLLRWMPKTDAHFRFSISKVYRVHRPHQDLNSLMHTAMALRHYAAQKLGEARASDHINGRDPKRRWIRAELDLLRGNVTFTTNSARSYTELYNTDMEMAAFFLSHELVGPFDNTFEVAKLIVNAR